MRACLFWFSSVLVSCTFSLKFFCFLCLVYCPVFCIFFLKRPWMIYCINHIYWPWIIFPPVLAVTSREDWFWRSWQSWWCYCQQNKSCKTSENHCIITFNSHQWLTSVCLFQRLMLIDRSRHMHLTWADFRTNFPCLKLASQGSQTKPSLKDHL